MDENEIKIFVQDEYCQKEMTEEEYLSCSMEDREYYCINELQTYVEFPIIRNKDFHTGYIKELEFFIEVDFEYRFIGHRLSERYTMYDEKLKDKLKCEIFRIREKRWITDKDKIINEFLGVIEKIKNENNK